MRSPAAVCFANYHYPQTKINPSWYRSSWQMCNFEASIGPFEGHKLSEIESLGTNFLWCLKVSHHFDRFEAQACHSMSHLWCRSPRWIRWWRVLWKPYWIGLPQSPKMLSKMSFVPQDCHFLSPSTSQNQTCSASNTPALAAISTSIFP